MSLFDRYRIGLNRRFPSVEQVEPDIDQIREATNALKESVEILIRQRGNTQDSALLVSDLDNIGLFIYDILRGTLQSIIDGARNSTSTLYKTSATPAITVAITTTPIKLVGVFEQVFNEDDKRLEASLANSQVDIYLSPRGAILEWYTTFVLAVNRIVTFAVYINGVATGLQSVQSGQGINNVTSALVFAPIIVSAGDRVEIWVFADGVADIDFHDTLFLVTWVPTPPKL